MLMSEIVDRAWSEYLFAGNVNRPLWDNVPLATLANATSITLEGLADDVPDSGTLEWDDSTMELSDIKDTTGSTVTLRERGYLETTAAAHDAGVRVFLDNPYPRQVVFNAVKSVIGRLYAYGIYKKTNLTSLTYAETAPVALPSGARDTVGDVWTLNGTRYEKLRKGVHYEVIQAFTPPRIQFFTGGTPGSALVLDYKSDFTRPTLLSDNLTTLGVPEGIQEGLPMAAAGMLMVGREVPKIQADHIRKALEGQDVPVGSLASIGRTLWSTFITTYIQEERVRQLEQNPTTIQYGD